MTFFIRELPTNAPPGGHKVTSEDVKQTHISKSHWQCICFARLAAVSENIAGRRGNGLGGVVLHRPDLRCGLIISKTFLINISDAKVITSAPAFNFHPLTAVEVCGVAQRWAKDAEVHSDSTRLAKLLPPRDVYVENQGGKGGS